jgi:hypothetical protein
VVPTAAQIAAGGGSGASPFSVNTAAGTCPGFVSAGVLTLQPGETCSVDVVYTPNPTVPQAGALMLFTNDPAGPLTEALLATSITQTGSDFPEFAFTTVHVAATASASSTGSFTVNATVLERAADGSYPDASGPLAFGVINNATGVTAFQQTNVMPGTAAGTTSFSVSGLKTGTYTMQAVYLGDGSGIAAYSPAQTLVVSRPVDATEFATVKYNQFIYGATAQTLNFTAAGYSNPQTVENQDFLAGNAAVQFVMTDSYGYAVDTTSTVPLFVDAYKITPVVTNAAALNYGVTAHPVVIDLRPADLTIYNSSGYGKYGQYLTNGTADATHYSVASVPYVYTNQQVVLPDIARGAITLTTSVVAPPVDPTTNFLPPGQYPLTTTVSGPGQGNYSVTNHNGLLQMQPADLTMWGAKFHVTAAQAENMTIGQLCGICYTAPNASLFTSATNITIQWKLTKTGNPTPTLIPVLSGGQSYANSPLSLGPGTYTFVAVLSGPGASNYSVTAYAGTLVVQ